MLELMWAIDSDLLRRCKPMKKKGENILIMVLFALMLGSCSKDKEKPIPQMTKKIVLPSVISLVYSSERTIIYNMAYNKVHQLIAIDIFQKTLDDEVQLGTKILYDEKGSITSIHLENINNGFESTTTFDYDTGGDIVDIVFSIGGDEQSTTFFYDPDNRIYGVDGDLGNFPMGWRFDQEGNLSEMSLSSNFFQLTYSGNEKGLFYQLEPQPALAIWYGLLFYLTSYELYYFHQKDLNRFETNNFLYRYENKVRDEDGNLIAFKMVPDNPMATTINYTISYDRQ